MIKSTQPCISDTQICMMLHIKHTYLATLIILYTLDVETLSRPYVLLIFVNLSVCSYNTTYYPVDLYH